MGSRGARRFDVCNGDADGLCAVVQWRLQDPADATLVTGLKREIALLDRVPPDAADEVLVCDLSLQRNRPALDALLAAGVRVRYFDHHQAGDVPAHPGLETHLDFGADVCTSVLVDRHLGGAFRAWAVVGAYGDELPGPAGRLADSVGLDADARRRLQRLGEAVNYNAYGEQPGDVLIQPAALYRILVRHPDPLVLCDSEPVVAALDRQRGEDLATALAIAPLRDGDAGTVRQLPDAPWSRRVVGCLANEAARAAPDRAQAVLKARAGGGFTVSVRAPRASPVGASALCAGFGGAGRASAAGIDHLREPDLDRFLAAFEAAAWRRED